MSDSCLTFFYENSHRGELSSLALAHVGDAVFELLVRTRLCEHELTAERLHRRTVELVCAPAQAAAARAIMDALTEEELDVFRRARNAKPPPCPSRCDRCRLQSRNRAGGAFRQSVSGRAG